MTYTLRFITDQGIWEDFVSHAAPHSFLQSWKWGLQYGLSGSKIFRIGMFDEEKLVAAALLIRIGARRGSFLLCPHGPVVLDNKALPVLIAEITRLGKEEQCDFVRICPLLENTPENVTLFREQGFRPAPIHMHPELSWILDITKPEEELLKEMRKTTRYLIKKTEKDGVQIKMSDDPDDIEKFWPVYQATVNRQHFTPFSKSYLRQEFELFAKDKQAAFFFGVYQGKVIAAAIIIFYGKSGFYHHSGSLQIFDKINASYLLQWRVIQEAKRRGYVQYNFWGISPDSRPQHPWAGLSLFKKGFGGFAEEYVHAQDKPLTPKYNLNFVIETARRLKRGL